MNDGDISKSGLARIFHTDRDEETVKADEVRRAMKSDDGCMSPYCLRKTSSSTQHPSGFSGSAVDQYEISGLDRFLLRGECMIGEILLKKDCSLRHHEDQFLLEEDLLHYETPQAAREIIRYDAQGKFRPLKTAPNLRRGWLLKLNNIEDVILALDFFYPMALHLYEAFLENKLSVTPLRETLDRQTGMYRITQLLKDEQAQELISKSCCSENGCLRQVLWSISKDQAITTLSDQKKSVPLNPREIPLLCREACNLLVAAARPLGKMNLPS